MRGLLPHRRPRLRSPVQASAKEEKDVGRPVPTVSTMARSPRIPPAGPFLAVGLFVALAPPLLAEQDRSMGSGPAPVDILAPRFAPLLLFPPHGRPPRADDVRISAGFGTLTHAVKGNVDVLMALVMHTGAALGAQIGAVSTRFFAGPRIRLLFSILPLVGALMVLARLLSGGMVHF